jgi:hypothetical protein
MDDNNLPSSYIPRLINVNFLEAQLDSDSKYCSLLIYTCKTKRAKKTDPKHRSGLAYYVECMTSIIQKLVLLENEKKAQLYAIVNTNDEHYVNIEAEGSPSTWADVAERGLLCRPADRGMLCRCQFDSSLVQAPATAPETPVQAPAKTPETPVEAPAKTLGTSHRAKLAKGTVSIPQEDGSTINKQIQYMSFDGSNWFGQVKKGGTVIPLETSWVLANWPLPSMRKRYTVVDGKFLKVQVGDPSYIVGSPPAHFHETIQYRQHGLTCLASSFASVLHLAGEEQAAMALHQKILKGQLDKGANDLLAEFVNAVNTLHICRNPNEVPMLMHKQCPYDIFNGPSPAAVVLRSADNGIEHAVSIYRNFIVDSSWPYALPRTKETLDWCCLPSQYLSPFKVYVLY